MERCARGTIKRQKWNVMFKSLKEKKLGDKANQRAKTSTPQKVPSDSSTNDNSEDAKSTAKAATLSDHQNEKEISSVSTTDVVAATPSNNSSQEEPIVEQKVC